MQMGSMEKILAANEATFAYHTVKHRQPFKSMDVTAATLRQRFGSQFTCTPVKCEAIVRNVLHPHVLSKTSEEVKNCEFVSVLFEASNLREIKVIPVLIRYFHLEKGVCIKLLQLKSLEGETAENITAYIYDTISQSSLQTKVIAISADNNSTNFGGSKRSGHQKVLPLLEGIFKKKLTGIVCSARIVHNAIKVAADILPIDVEIVIGKIYQYFKTYTVRAETLKAVIAFEFVVGSNASMERVSSRIFEIWTENKFELSIQSLRAIITVDNNLNMTCKDFYKYISNESELLNEIHTTDIYGASTFGYSQSSISNDLQQFLSTFCQSL